MLASRNPTRDPWKRTFGTLGVTSCYLAAHTSTRLIAARPLQSLLAASLLHMDRLWDRVHCRKAADYREVLEVNVIGPFLMTQAFVPLLRKKPTKVIVNTSSVLGSVKLNNEMKGLNAQYIAVSEGVTNVHTDNPATTDVPLRWSFQLVSHSVVQPINSLPACSTIAASLASTCRLQCWRMS